VGERRQCFRQLLGGGPGREDKGEKGTAAGQVVPEEPWNCDLGTPETKKKAENADCKSPY